MPDPYIQAVSSVPGYKPPPQPPAEVEDMALANGCASPQMSATTLSPSSANSTWSSVEGLAEYFRTVLFLPSTMIVVGCCFHRRISPPDRVSALMAGTSE